ncbi:unnamed protein product [marine sediment metagenome]|uniref:Uncharacterized protein n=1 Tax=marine sediment metagenome TaxID=412755 RepID=X1B6Z5_9ZZZZ
MIELNDNEYLERYFEESNLRERVFDLRDNQGMTHIMPIGCVIEQIKIMPSEDRKKAIKIMRKIDFLNGNMEHFLKYVAEGMINELFH